MIFERLRRVVADVFAVSEDSISMDTSFIDDLGADSLDIVELIMAIEEEFYVAEVDEETVEGLQTIGDVCRYISANE